MRTPSAKLFFRPLPLAFQDIFGHARYASIASLKLIIEVELAAFGITLLQIMGFFFKYVW